VVAIDTFIKLNCRSVLEIPLFKVVITNLFGTVYVW